MAEQQEQLIARIAEQVLATLQQQGVSIRPDGEAAQTAANIRPPAGVCTGDYSKFIELQGQGVGAAGQRAGGAPSGNAPSPTGDGKRSGGGAVLRGIVTARQIEAVLGAASPAEVGGVTLAPDAKLSPLARDYVKEKKLTVRRAEPASANAAGRSANAATAGAGWLWWIDGRCEVAEQLTVQQRDRLRPAGPRHRADALADAVRQMAGAVRRGEAAGGVLFVESAARAACFANRCPSLRAVVGTCGEAVEQGITQLGANVLIVEYPHVGPRAMRDMTARFIDAPRPTLADVDRQLQELSRCD